MFQNPYKAESAQQRINMLPREDWVRKTLQAELDALQENGPPRFQTTSEVCAEICTGATQAYAELLALSYSPEYVRERGQQLRSEVSSNPENGISAAEL